MKTDRLIAIIMVLLEKKKVSMTELASLCEVSVRTICRDLEAINLAGVPIVSYQGVNGGVGIMESYKIEKRLFTTADVTALLMGFGCIRSSLTDSGLAQTFAKIQGMIPDSQRDELEEQAAHITFDLSPWTGKASTPESFADIQRTIEEHTLITFAYSDRIQKKTVRTAEPYRLLMKGTNWYMDAYCHDREDFRTFKLKRMSNVCVTQTTFVPRDYTPPSQVHPFFDDGPTETVTVRADGEAGERLMDILGEEFFRGSENGWQIFSFSLPPGDTGYRFLAGLGADCECVSPEPVRQGIKEYLERMISYYEKP